MKLRSLQLLFRFASNGIKPYEVTNVKYNSFGTKMFEAPESLQSNSLFFQDRGPILAAYLGSDVRDIGSFPESVKISTEIDGNKNCDDQVCKLGDEIGNGGSGNSDPKDKVKVGDSDKGTDEKSNSSNSRGNTKSDRTDCGNDSSDANPNTGGNPKSNEDEWYYSVKEFIRVAGFTLLVFSIYWTQASDRNQGRILLEKTAKDLEEKLSKLTESEISLGEMQGVENILRAIFDDEYVKAYFEGILSVLNHKVSPDVIDHLLCCTVRWASQYMANHNKYKVSEVENRLQQVHKLILLHVFGPYLGKGFIDDSDHFDYSYHYFEPRKITLKELESNEKKDIEVNKFVKGEYELQIEGLAVNKDEAFLLAQAISKVVQVEAYINLIYLIGRTGIYKYEHNDFNCLKESEKYFEFAKSLGEDFRSFEYILSQRNGLGIINDCKIELAILKIWSKLNDLVLRFEGKTNEKAQRVADAVNMGKRIAELKDIEGFKKEISDLVKEIKDFSKDNIELYKKLRDDDKLYKYDYFKSTHNKIIPSKDIQHFLECNNRLIKGYSLLLSLEDSGQENVLKDLKDVLVKTNQGLLTDAKVNNLSPNFVASLINTLGFSLILLGGKFDSSPKLGNEFIKLFDTLSKYPNIHSKSDNGASSASVDEVSSFIPKIFEEARNKCFDDQYPRADAFDGSLTFCRNSKNGCSEEHIKNYIRERNKINILLDREGSRGDVVSAIRDINEVMKILGENADHSSLD